MKIGLFFGSFNPIHIGHLIIANTIVNTTDIDEVWFIVSPHNPLKKSNTLLHEFDRYDMVRAAIHDNFNFKVSDIEFSLPKPSYTIDTLIHLQEKYPKEKFALIIGEDNLDQFPKWKNYESILKYFSLYVYPRPQSKNSALKSHENVRMVESPLLDISATFIRHSIMNGQSIKYLVPEAVEDIIRDKKYYK
ncbi:MAG TPA: nicotinate (nicotinamide) nucleotide adenylyltransferase [Cytophagaceae bacterium]|jgi:nicotinate-nucleotide adenylyltransferase